MIIIGFKLVALYFGLIIAASSVLPEPNSKVTNPPVLENPTQNSKPESESKN